MNILIQRFFVIFFTKLILIICSHTPICTAGMLVTDEVPIIQSNALPSPLSNNNTRFVTIYIPEEAATNPEKQFPVIYYLPGLGGDNLSFTIGNKIILDDLIAKKEICPCIVVHVDPSLVDGIDSDGKRRYGGTWYVNSSLNGDFEDFIVQDLIPYIDANYQTLTDKAFRGVMGQSMGGFGALFLGTTHPELFVGMGAFSATPFWAIATNVVPFFVDPGTIDAPGDEMFVFNSLILPEIPNSGPNAGKVTPENGPLTFSVFSYAAAFSPNLNNPPYFVDLPFVVNPDSTPVFANGTFEISKTVFPGGRIATTTSLIPRADVIKKWCSNNPFVLIDAYKETLQEQIIFFDGGNIEIINAAGARVYSDKLAACGIDHEYLLYNGDHTDCLVQFSCARHATMFQLFSAAFSKKGINSQTLCQKITGNTTITLENNDIMHITDKKLLCIETDPDNAITETNVIIEIKDNAKLILGSNTSETPQGGIQIGNHFSKARLCGNPALKNHTITCTIIVNGDNACLEIQRGGFLGLGAGIEGFNTTNSTKWSISTLTNVTNVTIDIRKGKVVHNILPGLIDQSSLIVVGLSQSYTLLIDPNTACILGGGSVLGMEDNFFSQPVIRNNVGLYLPGGIRNNITFDPNATDFFYQKPMGSSVFYLNLQDFGLLASSGQLDNQVENGNNPFTITETLAESFCNKIAIDENDTIKSLESKEAILTNNNGIITLTYIDNEKNIIHIDQNNIPIGQNQQLNLANITNDHGYADIVVRTINGKETIIRVDDPEPVLL